MITVIDSSVIIKWFFEEIGSNRAIDLLKDHYKKAKLLTTPGIIYYEIGNVFRNKVASPQKINYAIKILDQCDIKFEDFTLPELHLIEKFAFDFQLSFYDASYVYLAQKLNTQLITADKKLYQQTKKSGLVKLL